MGPGYYSFDDKAVRPRSATINMAANTQGRFEHEGIVRPVMSLIDHHSFAQLGLVCLPIHRSVCGCLIALHVQPTAHKERRRKKRASDDFTLEGDHRNMARSATLSRPRHAFSGISYHCLLLLSFKKTTLSIHPSILSH
jgi:hypothetical protein